MSNNQKVFSFSIGFVSSIITLLYGTATHNKDFLCLGMAFIVVTWIFYLQEYFLKEE